MIKIKLYNKLFNKGQKKFNYILEKEVDNILKRANQRLNMEKESKKQTNNLDRQYQKTKRSSKFF